MPNVNFAMVLKGFQSRPGLSYFIGCDNITLNWLLYRFKDLKQSTSNDLFIIGDGIPIHSKYSRIIVSVGDFHSELAFIYDENHELTWSMSYIFLEEVIDKITSMIELGKPCHNYFDLSSGDIASVIISVGEYSQRILEMMEESAVDL